MTSRPQRFSLRIRVQITLLAVVVGATLLAGWQLSQSSGSYQSAVREDLRRQAAMIEDIRKVYADEAPRALQVAVAQARADRLRPLRNQGRLAASEYTLASQFAFHMRRSSPRDSLLGNDGYRYQDLGYDVLRRLADVQHDSPELYGLDPDARMRAGDRWATWGLAAAGVGAGAVLAAVCAANVVRPRRMQRAPAPSASRVLRELELLPQPATARTGHRRGALFHLSVFVLPLVLTLGQILVAGAEQRAQAEASRKAAQVSASIDGYGLRTAFHTEAQQTALAVEFAATARELASLDTGVSPRDAQDERVLAAVESTLAVRVRAIADYMGRTPGPQDRIDATAANALSVRPKTLSAAVAEQNHQVTLAEQAGRRSLLLSAATALAVVAEILAVAAFAIGRPRWLWWPALGALASTALAVVAFI